MRSVSLMVSPMLVFAVTGILNIAFGAQAGIFVVVALLLNRQRRKQLNFGMLSGMPELSQRQYPGRLLTEGIYGRIRHPRYIEAYMYA